MSKPSCRAVRRTRGQQRIGRFCVFCSLRPPLAVLIVRRCRLQILASIIQHPVGRSSPRDGVGGRRCVLPRWFAATHSRGLFGSGRSYCRADRACRLPRSGKSSWSRGTTLLYSGGEVSSTPGTRFENCPLQFSGAAARTVALLASMGMLKPGVIPPGSKMPAGSNPEPNKKPN